MIKKIFLTLSAALFAINTLNAVLPRLPHTTDLITLKQMFEKVKNDSAPKFEQLKALVVEYNKQDLFAENFEHIQLYLDFSDENDISEDDLIKKYQVAIGMLDWYLLQMSLWLHDLKHNQEDFRVMYFK